MQISEIENGQSRQYNHRGSCKLMIPGLRRDGGPWNTLGLAMRPEALREDYRMRPSSCISDLRPVAARSTSQPE